MTPTYFSSVFKKFNGLSLWDDITIKRVEKAIQILKTTDMIKLEIPSQPYAFYFIPRVFFIKTSFLIA